MKMYEAMLPLDKKLEVIMKEYGQEAHSRKYRVLCKCKNEKEAVEMFKKVALVGIWDTVDCCEEVRDQKGMEILKETDFAVCIDGDNFLTNDEINSFLLR